MSTSPHWLEMASWASQIGLMLIAGLAAAIGIYQLRLIRQSADQSARQATATFLLGFDRVYESTHFRASRTKLSELGRQIDPMISSASSEGTAIIRGKAFTEEFGRRLYHLRDHNRADYDLLIDLCGLFET